MHTTKKILRTIALLLVSFLLFQGKSTFVYGAKPTVDIPVSIVWNDSDNQDGIRPESVTFQLLRYGYATDQAITLSEETGWQGTFENLRLENDQNFVINYTISETPVNGYESVISGSDDSGFTITYTHTPETTDISGTITWDDQNDQDGKRPESVTIRLHANGTTVDEQTVNATQANNWSYRFGNLPKYQGGDVISYSVTLDQVPDYTTTMNGFDITNSHTPEKIGIEGTITWDDQDDLAKGRPENVMIQLFANVTKVSEQTVRAAQDGSWNYCFENRDKYHAGTEINYTIKEASVIGYTSNIHGFDITNRYTPSPAKATISVKKVLNGREWNENDVFEFVLSAKDEATKKAVEEQKVILPNSISATKANQTPSFEIIFHSAGEYNFTLSEAAGSAVGITYSSKVAAIQFKVYDSDENPDGKLDAVLLTPLSVNDLTFTSEYQAPQNENKPSSSDTTNDSKPSNSDAINGSKPSDSAAATNSSKPSNAGKTSSDNKSSTISATAPATGDDSEIGLWLTVTVSFAMLLFVLFPKKNYNHIK